MGNPVIAPTSPHPVHEAIWNIWENMQHGPSFNFDKIEIKIKQFRTVLNEYLDQYVWSWLDPMSENIIIVTQKYICRWLNTGVTLFLH